MMLDGVGFFSSGVEHERPSREWDPRQDNPDTKRCRQCHNNRERGDAWRDDNGHNSQESHQQGNHSHRQFQCRRGKFRPGGFKLFCGAHTGFDEQMIDAKFESRSSTPGDYGTGNHGTKACRASTLRSPSSLAGSGFPAWTRNEEQTLESEFSEERASALPATSFPIRHPNNICFFGDTRHNATNRRVQF